MLLTAESILALFVLVAVVLSLFIPHPNTSAVLRFVQANDEVTVLFETQGFCGWDKTDDCLNVRYYFCPDGLLHPYCVR